MTTEYTEHTEKKVGFWVLNSVCSVCSVVPSWILSEILYDISWLGRDNLALCIGTR
jgi:hypothetical protein